MQSAIASTCTDWVWLPKLYRPTNERWTLSIELIVRELYRLQTSNDKEMSFKYCTRVPVLRYMYFCTECIVSVIDVSKKVSRSQTRGLPTLDQTSWAIAHLHIFRVRIKCTIIVRLFTHFVDTEDLNLMLETLFSST